MPPQDHPAWLLAERRALGDRIRDRRMWRNLTQEKVAEKAGVSRDTVQRIERGTNDPRYSDLARIARALDTPLAELVGG
ncbi:helix-turn-helix domain-containing protein [Streptomyces albidoflavus]|uniref:helix-turn-helix domain-containing protein n=1 Tax=Streptomyces albidoflavus TaxID=1886 RepID=UPI00101E8065|nr:helix-turn-helix transcriptional regulator [Streptomyces albidoflavus]RZE18428.1 XRE family transcriptional regulator [Streptomyces albidoflavus]